MSRVAIMQPYFLPYLGYFQLISAADKFVVYDNIEFTKKGWFNRNRILNGGSDYTFTLPIKKDSDFLNVNQRFLADDSGREISKILRIIEANYKKAPCFDQIYPLIEKCFLYENKNLFEYIFHSLKVIAEYLDLKDKFIVSSEINIDHEALKGQDKVIAISAALEAQTYINPIGGQELYGKDDFTQHGVELKFLKPHLAEYPQFGNAFVPGLSIIDVLMFNPADKIQEMLKDYELV